MDLEALAGVVADHAVAMLLAASVLLLLLAAAFWRALRRLIPWLEGHLPQLDAALGRFGIARRAATFPLLRAALHGTRAAWRFLGVWAVLAFVFAGSATAIFVEIADEIGGDEELQRFDLALSDALREQLDDATLRAFALITRLGDTEVRASLGLVVLLVLCLRRAWLYAAAWAAATLGGAALNSLLKALFERTRPLHDHGLVSETSFSFPSGHAAGAMVLYALLGYLVVRLAPRAWHWPVAIAMALLIIWVGASRMMLNVHYFSDVLAGYASAAAWAALWIAGLECMRLRIRRATPATGPTAPA